jgi:hypothetical protein
VLLLGLRGKLSARADADGASQAQDAIALAASSDAINLQADAYANLAETERLLGRADEAGAATAKAVGLYARKGNHAAAQRLQTLKV